MEYRRKPEDVAHYRRTTERSTRLMNEIPAEVFKWVGAAAAIAAIHVVDIRLESAWLQWLGYLLSALLFGWINVFFYRVGLTKHPEEIQPDGTLVTRFVGWRLAIGIPLWALALLISFGLPHLIAGSDLLTAARGQEEQLEPAAQPASTPPKDAAPEVHKEGAISGDGAIAPVHVTPCLHEGTALGLPKVGLEPTRF